MSGPPARAHAQVSWEEFKQVFDDGDDDEDDGKPISLSSAQAEAAANNAAFDSDDD